MFHYLNSYILNLSKNITGTQFEFGIAASVQPREPARVARGYHMEWAQVQPRRRDMIKTGRAQCSVKIQIKQKSSIGGKSK